MKLDEAVMLLLRAAGLDHGSEMPSDALAKPSILGSLALAIVQVGTIIGQILLRANIYQSLGRVSNV